MRLLVIGHTWPEPTTTAAGGRMLQLIQLFQDAGYQIHLATTAEAGPHASDLHHLGVETYQIHGIRTYAKMTLFAGK